MKFTKIAVLRCYKDRWQYLTGGSWDDTTMYPKCKYLCLYIVPYTCILCHFFLHSFSKTYLKGVTKERHNRVEAKTIGSWFSLGLYMGNLGNSSSAYASALVVCLTCWCSASAMILHWTDLGLIGMSLLSTVQVVNINLSALCVLAQLLFSCCFLVATTWCLRPRFQVLPLLLCFACVSAENCNALRKGTFAKRCSVYSAWGGRNARSPCFILPRGLKSSLLLSVKSFSECFTLQTPKTKAAPVSWKLLEHGL